MRIILYTGKGGVGKTTLAAATAVRAAALGYRTIILSTDAAHSLADSFDVPLHVEPVEVAPRLWAHEMDMAHVLDTHWGTVQEWLAALMAWRGVEAVVAEEMAILPGMEELASLLHVVHYLDSGNYDVILVDCAPTGETLRLLSFPEVMRWWMTRMFPVQRAAASVLRPIVKPFLGLPIPEDEVFRAVQSLFGRLERMRSLLTDPSFATVRLVVNPEKMVIKEAQRTFTYLNLYGYATDLVICNRLLPEAVTDPHFAAWKRIQRRHFAAIEEAFAPLPIRRVPLFDQEVLGLKLLGEMGQAIFGEEDPTQVYYHGRSQTLARQDGAVVLSLALPFVQREEIKLTQSGDELVVQVGRQRRNIILPRSLVGLPSAGARFEGNVLKIRFLEEEPPRRQRGRRSAEGRNGP